MKPLLLAICCIIAVFLVTSCTLGEKLTNTINHDYSYEEVMVNMNNLPLFADFTQSPSDVKTKVNDKFLVQLESLLDREKTRSTKFEHFKVKEIPFRSNTVPAYAVLSNQTPEFVSASNLSTISLFLIEVTDTLSNIMDRKVVTLVPDSGYMAKHPGKEYSYIDKGIFSGIILFSDPNGRFRDVYVYGGDMCRIINAEIIENSERDAYFRSCMLSTVGLVHTKGDDESEGDFSGDVIKLDASICIAEKKETEETGTEYYTGWFGINGSEVIVVPPDGGTTGGGGGGHAGGGGSISDPGTDLSSDGTPANGSPTGGVPIGNSSAYSGQPFTSVDEEIFKYMISLSAGEGGKTSGSGCYSPGTFVTCTVIPDQSYVFDRWTGDFKGCGESIVLSVNRSISSTAHFRGVLDPGPVRPCYNASRNMYNPLKEMVLAPTSRGKTNYVGSTFGKTRSNGTKNHNGLDLYAPEGTPAYAMFDGKVSKYGYEIGQPNRETEEWPDDYSGDTDGAGNRFRLECNINGKTYYFLYWHMMSGTPIAINPRTGKAFAPGDTVYAGEIIGYTGRTGNAYNVHFPHLHLSVLNSSWQYINPENFVNGKFQWENDSKTRISRRNLIDIKCDEEIQDIEFEF